MILVDTSVLVGGATFTDVTSPVISVISVGELRVGVRLAGTERLRSQRDARLSAILEAVAVLPVDDAVAHAYASLRSAAGRQPANDLWIAATAAAHDLELVTADERQAGLTGVRTRLIG